MTIDKLLGSQSIIISLDVDNSLFEKLTQIAEAGIALVEVNTTDKNLLTKIKERNPILHIGAGNITTTQQLEDCYGAEVAFITSPGFLPALAHTANIYSINYLPGVATLSEAMQAMAVGLNQVRPFPAQLPFCTLLNKSLPSLKLYPAEIEWDEAEHFLNLPAVTAVSIHNPEQKQLRSLASGILV